MTPEHARHVIDIDAITAATPDALHLPVAVAALHAGKHVFCEKPLAMNVTEARTMVEAGPTSSMPWPRHRRCARR